ncbi:MAG: DUF899 family protein [Armatimonadetes bacterium]|nr:DUF899 family protein [Armatimonadota bacterium]
MTPEIQELERRLLELKENLQKARQAAPRQEVGDASFATLDGDVRLDELFGDKDELWTVHNMGQSCPYCTLWADGLNGSVRHLEDRAAFVVVSPDSPAEQRAFAESRGWTFRMVSDRDRTFTSDMGYWNEKDGWWPGVSAFVREGGKIYRTGTAVFGPGDDFCPIWPMMDLMGGDKGWEPR